MATTKELSEIKTKIKTLRESRKNLEQSITQLRGKLNSLHQKIERTTRNSSLETENKLISSMIEQKRQLENEFNVTNKERQKVSNELSEIETNFIGIINPKVVIEGFNKNIPILLFPVRLETRFMPREGEINELWIRIYPDPVSIQTHESELTELELEAGQEFFRRIFKVIDGSDDEKREIWRQLTDRYEPERATWIIRKFLDNDYITNLDQFTSSTDEDSEFNPKFESIQCKQESWTEPPKIHIMPDCFVVHIFDREGNQILEKQGKPIPQPLIVGPSPYSFEPEQDEELIFDKDSEWIIDFEKAVEIGMGLKIDLTNQTQAKIQEGFSKIIVMGIKGLDNHYTNIQTINDLIVNHHYTYGFSFVPQGTPTNNTSTRTPMDSRIKQRFEIGYNEVISRINSILNIGETTVLDESSDGNRFCQAIGIENQELTFIENANGTENVDTFHMQKALWPITWDYFIRVMVLNGIIDIAHDQDLYESTIGSLEKHVLEYVRPNGPFSAIKVGSLPYAILPTTAYTKWQINQQDSNWLLKNDLGDLTGADHKLNKILNITLQSLYHKFHKVSSINELVPRIGGSQDPDKELIEILGMEPSSYSYYIQKHVQEPFLYNLVKILEPNQNFIDYGYTISILDKIVGRIRSERSWSVKWWREYVRRKTEPETSLINYLMNDISLVSSQWFEKPEDLIAQATVLNISPWGIPQELKMPLVTEYPSRNRLPDVEDLEENYISWLRHNLDKTKYIEWGYTPEEGQTIVDVSTSLLYNLLRHAILIKKAPPIEEGESPIEGETIKTDLERWFEESLEHLAELSSIKLELLLSGVLDVCSYRLDAWFTSLITKRLEGMRLNNREGLYLGSFGWVEDLTPSRKTDSSSEYIHAPSIPHATTSAVLRSAYQSQATKPDFNPEKSPTTINLSSKRIQKALKLCEGIRYGYTLGVLLGYQFEKGLHENYLNVVELDHCIYIFRELYPLKVRNDSNNEVGESSEVITTRNVVDGLKLVNDWKSNSITFGKGKLKDIHSEATGQNQKVYIAITRELNTLDDTLDSLGDLALAEGVFQNIQGNFERGGAVLDFMSGKTPPQSFDVVSTPRTGINLKHSVIGIFTDSKAEDWPKTPRGNVEPYLNAWAAKLLGDPVEITCEVLYQSTETGSDHELQSLIVTVKKLRLSPLDLVYCSVAQITGGESTELERRIINYTCQKKDLTRSQIVKINLHHAAPKSIAMLLPLARQILDVITTSRYLAPEDLYLPEEIDETIGFSEEDATSINKRIFGRKGLYNLLNADVKELLESADGISIPLIISPTSGTTISGKVNIQWIGLANDINQPITFQGLPVKYSVYYSKRGKTRWVEIAKNLNKNVYEWDTTELDDGSKYRIKVVAIERENELLQAETISEGTFSIRNTSKYITNPKLLLPKFTDHLAETVELVWTVATHSEGKTITYSVYYSNDDTSEWKLIATELTEPTFRWDTKDVEDRSDYRFKIVASEGDLSVETISEHKFTIQNTKNFITIPAILEPMYSEILLGVVLIKWSASKHLKGKEITYSVYYSPDDGITWEELVKEVTGTEYKWDTTTLARGKDKNKISLQYRIKIVTTDSEGYSVATISKNPYILLKIDPSLIRSNLIKISKFGIPEAIPDTAIENEHEIITEDLMRRTQAILREVGTRLKNCKIAQNNAEKAQTHKEKIDQLIDAIQAIIGEKFRIIPRFSPNNIQELRKTWRKTKELMQEKYPLYPILWFQQVAQTHPAIKEFETLMILAKAINKETDLSLKVGQLPYKANDRWLALPFKEKDEEIPQGSFSIVAYTPEDRIRKRFGGIMIDQWDEFIPNAVETTAIAYQYNKPNTEAPQALLLAVPPVMQNNWTWESLQDCIIETLEMAKVRAVDLDALGGGGKFLPALYLPTDFTSFYLGNKTTMEVHDRRNLKPECKGVVGLAKEESVYFRAGESLRNITEQRYTICKWCIGTTYYIGNSNTMEVHDHRYIAKRCYFDEEARKQFTVHFLPGESLRSINAQGYTTCPWCLTKIRYVGNSNTMEVHALRYENRNCQIDEIIEHEHIVYFRVGTSLRNINGEGFDNCHWCIGGSER